MLLPQEEYTFHKDKNRFVYANDGLSIYSLWLLWCCPLGHFSSLEGLCPTENAVWFRGFFCLSNKDVLQLQRAFMKRIQCLPINTATSAAYGLLGIRPVQQKLDLRKLTFLGKVLHNKNTLEYEIAQRQLAAKCLGSKSWFADRNRLLYKYNLPNIYHVEWHLESMKSWKSLLKKHMWFIHWIGMAPGSQNLLAVFECAIP